MMKLSKIILKNLLRLQKNVNKFWHNLVYYVIVKVKMKYAHLIVVKMQLNKDLAPNKPVLII